MLDAAWRRWLICFELILIAPLHATLRSGGLVLIYPQSPSGAAPGLGVSLIKSLPCHVLWSRTPCDAHKNKCKEPLCESLSFLTRAHCTLWSSTRAHTQEHRRARHFCSPTSCYLRLVSLLPFKPTRGTRGLGIGGREHRNTARNVLCFSSPTCIFLIACNIISSKETHFVFCLGTHSKHFYFSLTKELCGHSCTCAASSTMEKDLLLSVFTLSLYHIPFRLSCSVSLVTIINILLGSLCPQHIRYCPHVMLYCWKSHCLRAMQVILPSQDKWDSSLLIATCDWHDIKLWLSSVLFFMRQPSDSFSKPGGVVKGLQPIQSNQFAMQ